MIKCEFCQEEIDTEKYKHSKRKSFFTNCPKCNKWIVLKKDNNGNIFLQPYSEFIRTIYDRISMIYAVFGAFSSLLGIATVLFKRTEILLLFLGIIISSMSLIFSLVARHNGNFYKNIISFTFGVAGISIGTLGIIISILLKHMG